jgi:hypothetical protein
MHLAVAEDNIGVGYRHPLAVFRELRVSHFGRGQEAALPLAVSLQECPGVIGHGTLKAQNLKKDKLAAVSVGGEGPVRVIVESTFTFIDPQKNNTVNTWWWSCV